MADRLRSLVADERGVKDCCDEDVQGRRDALRGLRRTVEDGTNTDELAAFSALGDPTKYRAVRALVESGDEMCVCELDVVLEVTESAVSHALAELRDAGLVEREKRGRWRYYEATALAERLVSAAEEGG